VPGADAFEFEAVCCEFAAGTGVGAGARGVAGAGGTAATGRAAVTGFAAAVWRSLTGSARFGCTAGAGSGALATGVLMAGVSFAGAAWAVFELSISGVGGEHDTIRNDIRMAKAQNICRGWRYISEFSFNKNGVSASFTFNFTSSGRYMLLQSLDRVAGRNPG